MLSQKAGTGPLVDLSGPHHPENKKEPQHRTDVGSKSVPSVRHQQHGSPACSPRWPLVQDDTSDSHRCAQSPVQSELVADARARRPEYNRPGPVALGDPPYTWPASCAQSARHRWSRELEMGSATKRHGGILDNSCSRIRAQQVVQDSSSQRCSGRC